jgi:4-amino-4-deoxychorismate lyase
MCRLVESIKVEHRRFVHIEWHNKRFNEARRELFGIEDAIHLEEVLAIPADLTDGVYKCRVLYRETIEAVEFVPYMPREIKTLRLVDGGTIDYHLKYENRTALAQLFAQKGETDDILIVKDGCITDTSFANIAFFDGEQWFTPDTFLLNGTQRQRLLSEGILHETHITPADLPKYTCIKLINAMLDWKYAMDICIII